MDKSIEYFAFLWIILDLWLVYGFRYIAELL